MDWYQLSSRENLATDFDAFSFPFCPIVVFPVQCVLHIRIAKFAFAVYSRLHSILYQKDGINKLLFSSGCNVVASQPDGSAQ